MTLLFVLLITLAFAIVSLLHLGRLISRLQRLRTAAARLRRLRADHRVGLGQARAEGVSATEGGRSCRPHSTRLASSFILCLFPLLFLLVVTALLWRISLVSAAGTLTVEVLAGYNLVVDSNVESPSTYAPSVATVGARFCNSGDQPLTDVQSFIGNYVDGLNDTPGLYPSRNSTAPAFTAQHPHLANTGPYAFTHVGGRIGLNDASRYIGTLAPGECRVQYWHFTYPRRANPNNSGVPVWGQSSVPGDDLWLQFDVWGASAQSVSANATWTMTMRNEISAMANKIQPNGGVWFNTNTSLVKPGDLITSNGVRYELGNINKGFDNDGNGTFDYNAWLQPVGDPSYDPTCFRLIRTSGALTVSRSSGNPNLVIPFTDQLYFTNLPVDNTGVVGDVYYTFMAMNGPCSTTLTPYQEVASGADNEKFNGDYGVAIPPVSSSEPEVEIDKNGNATVSLGGTINYEVPAVNSGLSGAGLPLGSTGSNALPWVPLVFSDTVPAGMIYQAGSATHTFTSTGVIILYSVDNGDNWLSTEPVPASSVTTIQWWLTDTLQAGESGSVNFAVTVPVTYSNSYVENCAEASFAAGTPFAEACTVTLVQGPNRIGDTVWKDDDGDGLLDAGETGLANVTLNLYLDKNGDGLLDSGDIFVITATTSITGNYSFNNLPNGNFLVQVDLYDPDLPAGYGSTTDTLYAVTLNNNNFLNADFGFGPSLALNKVVLTSPALEGGFISYRIDLTNLRPGTGTGQPGLCTYDVWATNQPNPAGTDWVNPAFAIGAAGPNGTYTVGDFSGNRDSVQGNNFVFPTQAGNITSVEAIYSLYLSGVSLSDDDVFGYIYTGTTQISTTLFSNAFLNANYSGAANQDLLFWNVTNTRPSWSFADFTNGNLRVWFELHKNGGSDGAVVNLDALGFRITTDANCNDPDDTLNPVPLTDTFNASLLQFVSASPSQTSLNTGGTNPYPNTGTVSWSNVGPLSAGQTKSITVTFRGLEPPGNLSTIITNTATVSGAKFATGEPANNGQDSVTTTLQATARVGDRLWNDNGDGGGIASNGTQDGGEGGIPGVIMELYASNGTTLLLTTTTSITGYYLFEGLSASTTYVVKVNTTSLPGATFTQTGDPDLPGQFCDPSGPEACETEFSVTIAATPADNFNVDFGFTIPNTVFGNVWEDNNGNSLQNLGENGFSGVTVELRNNIGTLVATTTTDANGNYYFSDLANGTYFVQVVTTTLPAGGSWTQTVDPEGNNDSRTNNLVVSGGNVYGSYDFAYTQSGPLSLGDTLYVDWNGNGTQDAGEEGIPNITVSLYEDSDGDGVISPTIDTLIITTTTTSAGFYNFTNLPQDKYIVVVNENDPDFPFAAGSYERTQDYDSVADGQATVNLTVSLNTVDFGYQPIGTASIGDFVWRDNDHDGLQDGGESGIANILITLYEDTDGNGVISPTVDAVVMTTTTNASGIYTFSNLPAGNYLVDVDTSDADLPVDSYGKPYILSTNNDPKPVTLSTGQSYLLADFGFTAGGTIGDLIWRDDDRDGALDASEPGLSAVRVLLYNDLNGDGLFSITDTLVTSATTSATGIYTFTGLPAGKYVVLVDTTTTPTTTFTYDLNGALDGQAGVTLTAGQLFLGADFGLPSVNGSIGDQLWIDLNGDNTYEVSEPGLAGVVISLTNSVGAVITTTTDADGHYLFPNLPDGVYTVTVNTATLPTGISQSFEADGTLNHQTTVTIGAGVNDLTVDFGYLPQLTVSKSATGTGSSLAAGDTITYTLVVSNPSPGAITGVTISDTVPANTDFVPGSLTINPVSAGSPGTPPVLASSLTVVARSSVTLTYRVVITNPLPANVDTITNTVLMTSSAGISDTETVTNTVGATAELVISKRGSSSMSVAGQVLTYTLVFTNNGPAAAQNVTVTEQLPAGVSYGGDVSLPSGMSRTNLTPPTWVTPTLGPGQSGTIIFTVTVGSGVSGTITNTVSITTTTPDSNPSNNNDVEPTTIQPLATIGDRVWNDTNGNGIQDGGETGISGITITLYQGVTPVQTTTTNASGLYTFTNVVSGTYSVQFNPPLTYTITGQGQGGNNNLDSDPNPATGRTATFPANAGQVITNVDAGLYQPATLSGQVREDTDGDGNLADPDSGINNVTVVLYTDPNGDGNPADGTPVLTTTTTITGGYLFTNVAPGSYVVVETDLNGYSSTADTDAPNDNQVGVTVNSGQTSTGNDFLDTQPGTISGEVREDTDGDGNLADPDSGMTGVTVVLYTDPNGDGNPADGIPVLTQTTTITGGYVFTNVTPGNYVVVETDPSGYSSTADTDAPNNNQVGITLTSGVNSTGNDFLDTQPASISGQVREDTDGDGNLADPDSGIPSVTVVLYTDPNGDGNPADGTPILTRTTSITGGYVFTNVTPGNYVVIETDPSGYSSTADTDAPNDNQVGVTLASGVNLTGNDFLDTQPATISGQVREDTDGDGNLADPDSGLTGVTVVLYTDPNGDGNPADGTPVLTRTTSITGGYVFTNVTPGNYVVVEADPNGYSSTADTDAPNNNQVGVTLTSGQTSSGNDFLDTQAATISGQVREDADGDGNLADPDSGLTGVTVVLYTDPNGDGNPADGAPVLTRTTTITGGYVFTDVIPGNYVVVETDPSGYNSTADTDAPNNNQVGVTVNSGQTSTGNDFLDTRPASISGQVREDADGDGNLTDPDSGLTGVTVVLYTDPNGDGDPADGTPVLTTTTTITGGYLFTNVTPGNYVVAETDPNGYNSTADTDAPNDNEIGVTLTSGTNSTGNDFLDTRPASISGQVREDTDGDGNLADPDSGLTGVTVVLYTDPNGDGNPADGVPVLTRTTTITGGYVFTNVTPGSYVVVETDPNGYSSTADTDAPNDNQVGVTVNSGQTSTGNDFLDTQPGTISGEVREDTDGDGNLADPDSGMTGVTVVLYTDPNGDGNPADGTPVLTTTTTITGGYIFPNVTPGNYVVVETDPNGYSSTADTDAPNDNEVGVTLASGQTSSGNDFLDTQAATISGQVREDTDGDGNLADPDSGLTGVTVVLYTDPNGDGNPADGTPVLTTTTTITGGYLFTNVIPGNYVVVETDPNGYSSTADTDAPNNNQVGVTLTSGVNSAGNDFLDTQPGTISGEVREDTDGDGNLADPDSGMTGVTVVLYTDPNGDGNPADGAPVLTTTTTITGGYVFTDVIPGNYVVVETDPPGYSSTADTDAPNNNQVGVTLTSGVNSAGNDFLDTQQASISGQVREDADGDGNLADPDSGLTGVTVVLYTDPNGDGNLADGTPILTTTTTITGGYVFTNVTPGSYVVVETDPNGYSSTADTDAPNNNQVGVTLTSGTNSTGNDFLDTLPATVTGQVREDTDGDGNLADPDSGLTGVTVVLYTDPNGDGNPADGIPVLTRTTTITGGYVFTNVTPGSYVVVETDPNGYSSTADTDAPNDNEIGVTLTSGQTSSGNDFLDTQQASISGQVREDTDGDGNLADPDSGLTGVTVVLYTDPNGDGNPADGTPVLTRTTSITGGYVFTNVTPGSYVVVETDLSGYGSTADTDAPNNNQVGVTLTSGTNSIGNDFLDTRPATVSGQVREDTDGDGNLADPDSGLTGVTVVLYTDPNGDGNPADGTPVLTTTTTITGGYVFTNVTPGNYVVVETDPSGYNSTGDSDAPNDNRVTVTLTSGTNSSGNDFLDSQPAPGITIAKTPDNQQVVSGNTVTFTLRVTNTGNVALTNVTVSDPLAPACARTLGALAPGASTSYTCTLSNVTVDFTNVATATGTPPAGPNVSDNDNANVDVTSNPGLEVEKSIDLAEVAPNQVVTYTIAITNTGNVVMRPVRVTDTLPLGFSYVLGSGNPLPNSITGGRLVWNDVTGGAGLAPNQVFRLTFRATMPVSPSIYINTAVVAGTHPNGVITDTDTAPVVVSDPAVELVKTASAPGMVDGLITFTIRITNTGPSVLDEIPLVDHFTGPVVYVGGTPPADVVDNVNQVIGWNDLTASAPHGFGRDLAPQESFVITTVFSLTTGATTFSMTNVATVNSAVDVFNNPANDDSDSTVITNEPTAIELLYFRAEQQGNAVNLNWATAVELDNFGFRILRSSTGSLANAIDLAFIPGRGHGTASGASYSYSDKTAGVNQSYSYWLVDVDFNGLETFHGPIAVTNPGIDQNTNTSLFLPLIVR